MIPALEPPLDSVEEFRMELNTTPANVQTGAAGVISLVSKSGTDQFHGDGFLWLRPDGLDANDYFNNLNGVPIPDFHRYQWGGSFGSPIKKNKFFFFADYEGTQQSTAAQLTTTVPAARKRLVTSPGIRTLLSTIPSTSARILPRVRQVLVRRRFPTT